MFDLGITMDKRQLLALCFCTLVATFNGTITVSLTPVYAVEMGADPATTGLYVAFAFLTVTLGNITGGWLADRLGRRKPLLLISCAVWSPAAFLMVQAQDIYGLMLTTALFWFPGGVALAMANIIAGLSTTADDRGKVFGWMALSAGVGGLLAGIIAGPVVEQGGFPGLFGVMAVSIALMLAVATTIQDKPTPRLGHELPTPTPDRAARKRQPSLGRALIFLLVAHLLVRLGQLIGGLGSPLVMTQLGFDAAEVSSAIAVSAAVTLPLPLLLGWLSDKAGRKRFLILGYAAGMLGLLVLITSVGLWQFWVSASLIAISNSVNGVAQAFAADLVLPQAMGRSMSLYSTTSLFAGILGLSGGGYLMQTLGIESALFLGASLPFIAIALILLIRNPVPIAEIAPSSGANESTS